METKMKLYLTKTRNCIISASDDTDDTDDADADDVDAHDDGGEKRAPNETQVKTKF
jgi:hypothetical protein